MNDNVVKPTKQKVKDGHLWEDMKTSASGIAAKVSVYIVLFNCVYVSLSRSKALSK